jgi:hypothetical protein
MWLRDTFPALLGAPCTCCNTLGGKLQQAPQRRAPSHSRFPQCQANQSSSQAPDPGAGVWSVLEGAAAGPKGLGALPLSPPTSSSRCRSPKRMHRGGYRQPLQPATLIIQQRTAAAHNTCRPAHLPSPRQPCLLCCRFTYVDMGCVGRGRPQWYAIAVSQQPEPAAGGKQLLWCHTWSCCHQGGGGGGCILSATWNGRCHIADVT